ncbi:CPBP family intramembrane glutamic endopeptidase [Flavobacterium magnesitis]|uniref:CPBP family intramembrane glutamic endopeptidase n=1 Tax=Flavobacterium magnesitis TaxID=3138077 RepID=UPI00358ED49D
MSIPMFIPLLMQMLGYRLVLFNNIGLDENNLAPWYAWTIALIVTLLYVLYTFKKIPFVYKMQKEVSLFKILGLVSIIGGLIEELVFRQWLMDLFAYKGYGIIIQVLISAILFSLIHIVWVIFSRDIKFLLGAFISTFLLGTLLGIVYLIGNRNVGPCIISHALINIIIEPWLLLAAISKDWKTKIS